MKHKITLSPMALSISRVGHFTVEGVIYADSMLLS